MPAAAWFPTVLMRFLLILQTIGASQAFVLTKRDRLHSPLPTALFYSDVRPIVQARQYIRSGMEQFRNGDIATSIQLFDAAEAADPNIAPFLWQRGISYYYDNRFNNASVQFRLDTSVNPNDTEEIVWDIASQLRTMKNGGSTFPIDNPLKLPRPDPRPVMNYVYRLFRGEGTEAELALYGHSKAGQSDEFYSLFYLGLYNEARNHPDKAKWYLLESLQTVYGRTSPDYMVSCAKVHCQLRGWEM